MMRCNKRMYGAILAIFLAHGNQLIAAAVDTPCVQVVGDIEGDWHKIASVANKPNSILRIMNDNPDNFSAELVGKKSKLVFLGDSIDKGANNVKVLRFLVYLKNKYPHRVFLILGNRDINKLRLKTELRDEALDLSGADRFAHNKFRIAAWEQQFDAWINEGGNRIDGALVAYTHGKNPATDKLLKLKFLLSKTMGAPTAFEDFKKELNLATDAQAYDRYIALVKQGGLLATYLQKAQLVYVDKATKSLFVHGALLPENLGVIPGQPEKLAVPGWVYMLNLWGKYSVARGLQGDIRAAMPIIEYQEPAVIINAQGKRVWGGDNKSSVVHARPWSASYNLEATDPAVVRALQKYGIDRIFHGHTPIGKVSVMTRSVNGFLTVACDTSVTNPARNAIIIACPDEVTISADYDKPDGELVHLEYSSNDPRIGKQLPNGFWMIAPNLKGIWHEAKTKEGKGLGFSVPTYEYGIIPAGL